MHNTIDKGKRGEDEAEQYLLRKGFEILARNYRYRRSEIDIIGCKDGLLVFIEVKMKSYVAYGQPEDAVNKAKVRKVLEGAEHYIYEINWQGDVRFDVISIVEQKGLCEVCHFEDAFH